MSERVTPKTSVSWKASVPISALRTWPVMQTRGTESILASAMPVTRLVAPGTAGGHGDADFAGNARVAFGGEDRALLVASQNVAHAAAFERVIQRHDRAAGIAEDQVHAFRAQALQDDVGSFKHSAP